MSPRLSEPPMAKRAKSFMRRWHKSGLRAFIESRAVAAGGPVALIDTNGEILATFRGATEFTSLLPDTATIELGTPPVARLVGDVASLDTDVIDIVRLLVRMMDDFDGELADLSHHALERYRELSLLGDFSEQSSAAIALPELMDIILRKAVAVVRAEGAALVLLDDDGTESGTSGSVGGVPSPDPDMVSQVASIGRVFVGSGLDDLMVRHDDSGTGNLACLPLRTAGRTNGILLVQARSGHELMPDDLRVLTTLASFAATRIDQVRLMEVVARKRELAALGQVVSGIVHDFKNPLTAMRGFAEMIQMGHVAADEHPGLAELIIENADRLWAMVEEILHFIRGNRASLVLTKITGADLQQRLCRALRMGKPGNVELSIDLEAIPDIVVDPDKLERVLINLVRNAREAIVGSGKIDIMGSLADPDGQLVTIVVRDNGPGIAPHLKEVLFDPFVTAGKSGGTGLGLAIVKKVIEDHGGTVCVESELGQGARFIITLMRSPLEGRES